MMNFHLRLAYRLPLVFLHWIVWIRQFQTRKELLSLFLLNSPLTEASSNHLWIRIKKTNQASWPYKISFQIQKAESLHYKKKNLNRKEFWKWNKRKLLNCKWNKSHIMDKPIMVINQARKKKLKAFKTQLMIMYILLLLNPRRSALQLVLLNANTLKSGLKTKLKNFFQLSITLELIFHSLPDFFLLGAENRSRINFGKKKRKILSILRNVWGITDKCTCKNYRRNLKI